MTYWLVRVMGICWLRLFQSFRIVGAENIPAEGGAIIASNHASMVDPLVLGSGSTRRITFVARGTLAEHRLFRLFVRLIDVISISRDVSDRVALRAIGQELGQGRLCCIFPEGTRTLNGRMQALKSGFALIAQRAGVPVVPAYVAGTFRAWPKGRRAPRLFAPIGVCFGEPLYFDRDLSRGQCTGLLGAALESLEANMLGSKNSDPHRGSLTELSDAQGCAPTAKSASDVDPASNSSALNAPRPIRRGHGEPRQAP